MAEQTLPSPAALLVKPDGRPDDTWYQRLTLMWKAYNQTRQDVTDAATSLTDDIDDGIDARIATQAEQETGSSATQLVSPARQHHHQSAAKFWCLAGVAGNVLASYNIASVTDTGTGAATVNIATDFTDTNWAPATHLFSAGAGIHTVSTTKTAGTLLVNSNSCTSPFAAVDPTQYGVSGFGDQ